MAEINATPFDAEAQSPAVETTTSPKTSTPESGSPESKENIKSVSKTSKQKDYNPTYTDEQKTELETISHICEEEISRVIADPRYHGVSFDDGCNTILDVLKYVKDGGKLYTPAINRTHGGDEEKTGDSLLRYGAQHPLIVITTKMAKAAGLEVHHFDKDPDQKTEATEEDLVVLDGNGRIDYLLSIPVDQWPSVFAVFPQKDRMGYYNLTKFMEEINVNLSKWVAQDMVQKRLLTDGDKAHPGWKFIQDLVKNGYKYQAACEIATLEEDRIKVKTINEGKASDIFLNYPYALRVYDVAKLKFNEDVLKTKVVPKEFSGYWKKLNNKLAADKATDAMVQFINGLNKASVTVINDAKSKKGQSKDDLRVATLNDEFKKFVALKEIDVEVE